MSTRTKLRQQIKTNLQQFLEFRFLQEGRFFNVAKSQANYNGVNISQLKPETRDPRNTTNEVWQSPFHNWVFEDGVTVPSGFVAPVIPTGIFVNSSFKFRGDATYGHAIDFPNGRVIFDTPANLLSTDVVEAAFAYKQYHVQAGERHDQVYFNSLIESSLKDNPNASGAVVYPAVEDIVMPALFFDVTDSSFTGLALGGGKIGTFEITFHLFARDKYMADDAIDIIGELEDAPMSIVNFDTAPFPLDFDGDIDSGYIPYQDLQVSNLLYKGHFNSFNGTSTIPITPSNQYIFTINLVLELPDL